MMEIVREFYRFTPGGSEEIDIDGTTYKVYFDTTFIPSDNPCQECGRESSFSEEGNAYRDVTAVYAEIVDPEVMVPIKASSKLGRKIIKELKREMAKVLCIKCHFPGF